MHIEFLVEEPSAEAALQVLLSRMLEPLVTFAVHPHQGKQDLLGKLPARLRGYRSWLPDDWRIIVLLDGDSQDCRRLKQELETKVQHAGLLTRSAVAAGERFHVLNRIAIEELEAWFFGDIEAITAVYPNLSANMRRRAQYRNPDAIRGGTWEALERELQRAGYHPGGYAKIQAARDIAAHMEPERNSSQSFQVFWRGIQEFMRNM
jgi:hypothetical protein